MMFFFFFSQLTINCIDEKTVEDYPNISSGLHLISMMNIITKKSFLKRITEKSCRQEKKIPCLQGDQMQHKVQNPELPNRAELPHEK